MVCLVAAAAAQAATFTGSTTLDGGVIAAPQFVGLEAGGTVIVRNASVTGGASFTGDVTGATIHFHDLDIRGDWTFDGKLRDSTIVFERSVFAGDIDLHDDTVNVTLVWDSVVLDVTTATTALDEPFEAWQIWQNSNLTMRNVTGRFNTNAGGAKFAYFQGGMANSVVTIVDTHVTMNAVSAGHEFVRAEAMSNSVVRIERTSVRMIANGGGGDVPRCFYATTMDQASHVYVSGLDCTPGTFRVLGPVTQLSDVTVVDSVFNRSATLRIAGPVTDSNLTVRNVTVRREDGPSESLGTVMLGGSVTTNAVISITDSRFDVEDTGATRVLTFGASTVGGSVQVSGNRFFQRSTGSTSEGVVLGALSNLTSPSSVTVTDNVAALVSTTGSTRFILFDDTMSNVGLVVFRDNTVSVTGEMFALALRTRTLHNTTFVVDGNHLEATATQHAWPLRFGLGGEYIGAGTSVAVRKNVVKVTASLQLHAIVVVVPLSNSAHFAVIGNEVHVASVGALVQAATAFRFEAAAANLTIDISNNTLVANISHPPMYAPAAVISATSGWASARVIIRDNNATNVGPAGTMQFAGRSGGQGLTNAASIALRCNTVDGRPFASFDNATIDAIVTANDTCGTCNPALDCNPATTAATVVAGVPDAAGVCFCSCAGNTTLFADNTQGQFEQCINESPHTMQTTTVPTTTAMPTTAATTTTTATTATTTTTASPTTTTESATTAATPPVTTATPTRPTAEASLPPTVAATMIPNATTAFPQPSTTTAAAAATTTAAAAVAPQPPTEAITPGPTSLPAPVRQGGQGAVIVTSGGAGIAGGSPGWSAHASRNALLAALAACPQPLDGGDELDTVVNPTGLALGSAPTRQYLGALVADTAIVLGMALLQAAAGTVLYCAGGGGGRGGDPTEPHGHGPQEAAAPGTAAATKRCARRTLAGALLAAKLPRANYVWFLLFLQPITQCSLVLASQSGDSPLAFVAGIVAFGVAQGGSLALVFMISGDRLTAVYVERPWAVHTNGGGDGDSAAAAEEAGGREVVTAPPPGALPPGVDPDERDAGDLVAPANPLVSAFTPRGDWFAGDSASEAARLHHAAFKPLYGPFRAGGRLFVLADLALALVFGVAAAVFPTSRRECVAQMAVILGAMLCYFAAAALARPFAVPLDNALLGLLAGLELAAAGALLVQVATDDAGTAASAQAWSEGISTATTWVTFGVLAKDCCVAVGRAVMKRREAARRAEALKVAHAGSSDIGCGTPATAVSPLARRGGSSGDPFDGDDDGVADAGKSRDKNPIVGAFAWAEASADGAAAGGADPTLEPAGQRIEHALAAVSLRVAEALAAEADQWNVAADGQHWVLHVPDPEALAAGPPDGAEEDEDPDAAGAAWGWVQQEEGADVAADDVEEEPVAACTGGSSDGLAEVWCDPETGFLWDAPSGWWHDPASGEWWADADADVPAGADAGATCGATDVPSPYHAGDDEADGVFAGDTPC